MKRIVFLVVLIISVIANAQVITFEDPVFKTVLTSVICADTDGDGTLDSTADLNNDGEIEVSEAEAITGLGVHDSGINSLGGIEYFINIVSLTASENNLTSIDLSQNINLVHLVIYNNEIKELNLTNNVLLERLNAQTLNLSEVDLSENTNLTILNLSYNPITNLDLSNNDALEYLTIKNCLLKTIDVSNLDNLYSIDFSRTDLNTIDLSNNTQLYYVFAENSDTLTEIDISNSENLLNVVLLHNDQLNYLNIQNGLNENIVQMWAMNNPNLECIQVDDVAYSENQLCLPSNFSGWCIEKWTNYSTNCLLGNDDFSTTEISIFPNPAQDILQIATEYPIEELIIYNSKGKVVGFFQGSNINISHLKTGLYFITIKSMSNSVTKKFIKN